MYGHSPAASRMRAVEALIGRGSKLLPSEGTAALRDLVERSGAIAAFDEAISVWPFTRHVEVAFGFARLGLHLGRAHR